MKLTFEQIKSVAFGAVWIEEHEDGIHFGKCTKKQQDAFAVLHHDLGVRSLTTTGVRLDFHTNSKHLAFSTTSGRKFEVYLNDVLRAQFDCDVLREEGSMAEMDLTDLLGGDVNEIRVTLVFPSHSVGVLKTVELDDGATLIPHRFDTKILFVGDSITQGWNSIYDGLSYAWNVTRFFNAESIIQGIDGAYFHESTFDKLGFDPDTVIIAMGTNDFKHYQTQEEMRLHTAAFLSLMAAEYRNKKIFVISPTWRLEQEMPMGSFRELRDIVIEEAEKLGLRHIDGLTLVPPMPEFMADKRLHPNDIGFGIYAQNLIAQMTK